MKILSFIPYLSSIHNTAIIRNSRIVFLTCFALVIFFFTIIISIRYGLFRPSLPAISDNAGFMNWAKSRYHEDSKGNIAIVLLHRGKVVQTFYDSHGRHVDGDSLFQVASLSKWITAWGILKLVEEKKIELDAPVSRYLTRWHLPPSEYSNELVTIRKLLSHTAGLTDGLGFRGFPPGERLPSIEEELSHIGDALPSANGIIRVSAEPGFTWRYSGGGYLILQLLIEEVTKETFNDYMRRTVFEPLGMKTSTFLDPDPTALVDFYSHNGSLAVHYKFTALGAASLYTSTADLTRFVQAQVKNVNAADLGALSPQTLRTMQLPQAYILNLPVWGLGVTLYAPNGNGGFIIGHDGGNFPAINTTARLDPETGDGIIVLTTGSETLAREIGGTWTYWKTGIVSLDTMVIFDLPWILILFGLGSLIIVVSVFWFVGKTKKQNIKSL